MAAFIAAQGADHGIPAAVCCRALGVPRSWSCKWRDGDRSPRRARRERLKAEVARLFAGHKGKRGSPVIAADLRDAGWRVSKNTVAAVMAEMGLAARPKKYGDGTGIDTGEGRDPGTPGADPLRALGRPGVHHGCTVPVRAVRPSCAVRRIKVHGSGCGTVPQSGESDSRTARLHLVSARVMRTRHHPLKPS